MTAPDWLERLLWLAARYPQAGISPDLAVLAMAVLWAVYRFLSHLAEH